MGSYFSPSWLIAARMAFISSNPLICIFERSHHQNTLHLYRRKCVTSCACFTLRSCAAGILAYGDLPAICIRTRLRRETYCSTLRRLHHQLI
jgi:hypothetical protein